MKMLALLLLIFAASTATTTVATASGTGTSISPGTLQEEKDAEHARWVAGVENVLANVMLGPLKPEFTPAFLQKRLRESRETIVNAQASAFRAYVVRLLMNSLCPDGMLHVVVPPEYAPEVVEAQVHELRDRSFSVRWTSAGVGRDFIVNMPKSKQ